MAFTSLNEWLGWLETCHPQEIDLGLDRIRQVADRLQLTHSSARVVTVAGTNGKGSCVTATAALLRMAGFRTGVYTSPHLLHYCERIAIDGVPVTEQEVCDAFSKIQAAREAVSLTYFEFGTLAALDVFRQRQVDVIVLEVGLGGRLDAVNLLDADIAVITSIALDHQDWLGNDRESIGREKAGILRPRQHVICADPRPPQSVIEAAQTLQTTSYFIDNEFGFTAGADHWTWCGLGNQAEVALKDMPLPSLPLPSLAAALQVATLLGVDLRKYDVATLLAQLRLPGRFQELQFRQRHFVLDVAHNPAATAYLAERLRLHPCAGRTLGIVAMMADKDRSNSLGNLTHIIDSWFVADLSAIPRAATPDQLARDLRQLSIPVSGSDSVARCIEATIEMTTPEDRIIIFGSFYTVAAALAVLQTDNACAGSSL